MTGEPEIQVLADPEAVAQAAADRIAGALVAAVRDRGRADWATTGGSTPVGIYRALGAEPHRDQVPWRQVHVWWGDDRFVPRDHPLSNALPFDQVLERGAALAGLTGDGEAAIDATVGPDPGVGIPPANVHAMAMTAAIAGGRGADWVAARYAEELRSAGLAQANGFPVFDVILSGIGGDGHILSVFPGSTVFTDSTAWAAGVAAPEHIEPHVARVSLHPGVLGSARLTLVVAFGAAKAGIISEVLGATRDALRWPSQLARTANAVWLLDEAAAASLQR
jgi:6-phosphogluconolactonase